MVATLTRHGLGNWFLRGRRKVGLVPLLFYLTLVSLLVFFALAVVHELIPGLCAADEQPGQDCPFCRLVKTLTIVALLVVGVCCCTTLCDRVYVFCQHVGQPFPLTHSLQRAPPAQ